MEKKTILMEEWTDGQPICAAYYKTGCKKELKPGTKAIMVNGALIYCSEKCSKQHKEE